MTLYTLGNLRPVTPASSDYWVAGSAHVIGAITLGDATSVWFNATLRGDNEPIVIGDGTNIQESCVLHTEMDFPLTVGAGCTIGHQAMLHGCAIGDNTLIGMGACVLDGAVIGRDCLIGAGALVTQGKVIPDGSLAVGSPAKVVRALREDEIDALRVSAHHYQTAMRRFRDEMRPITS